MQCSKNSQDRATYSVRAFISIVLTFISNNRSRSLMSFNTPRILFAAAVLMLAGSAISCAQEAPAEPAQKPADTAHEAPPAAQLPEPSVLSLQCTVPSQEIATPAPLPATIARLQSGKTLRVLAIGSASVQQFDRKTNRVNESSQFASLLGKVLKDVKIEIVNRGVSGEVVSTAAQRLINEAVLARPNLVLWQLGTSDAISRVPVDEFIDTVRSTVQRLRANNIDVVLVGLQYTPQFARDAQFYAMRTALTKLASDEQIVLVRRYNVMDFIARTKANLQVTPDGEFNAGDIGPQCMAEHVAQAVIASVFLRRPRKPGNKS